MSAADTDSIRVAGIQLSMDDGRRPGERRDYVGEQIAGLTDVDLVVLPELWPGGFFAFDEYPELSETFDGSTVATVREAAAASGAWVMGGSFVESDETGRLYNTAFLVDPSGEVMLSYRKIHTFGFQSREADLLTPGTTAKVVSTPLGKIGLATCYDLRFPELFRLLVDQGADLFIVAAAWPAARLDHWRLLTRVRALENQAYMVSCCARGSDHGTELAGASNVVGPFAETLAEVGPGEALLRAELPMDGAAQARVAFPALSDRRLSREGR